MSTKVPCCSVENLLNFLQDMPPAHSVITDGSMIVVIDPETGVHMRINAQNIFYEKETKQCQPQNRK